MSRRRWTAAASALLLLGAVVAGCSDKAKTGADRSSGSSTSAAPTSTAATTTGPLLWRAVVQGQHEVNAGYRQGVARTPTGWIFTTDDGIFTTSDAFAEGPKLTPAIPASLKAQGYNHIGDGDMHGSELWLPLEKPDKSQGRQAIARYAIDPLRFIDSFDVPQHHASFVSVGPDGTVYSTDQFTDHLIQRYRLVGHSLQRLVPLKMRRQVGHIQGADFSGGALWLSTDDDHNGVWRVDLATGVVTDLGSSGHVAGEGEGIDVSDGPGGLLHVLDADEKLVPMWLVDMRVDHAPS